MKCLVLQRNKTKWTIFISFHFIVSIMDFCYKHRIFVPFQQFLLHANNSFVNCTAFAAHRRHTFCCCNGMNSLNAGQLTIIIITRYFVCMQIITYHGYQLPRDKLTQASFNTMYTLCPVFCGVSYINRLSILFACHSIRFTAVMYLISLKCPLSDWSDRIL